MYKILIKDLKKGICGIYKIEFPNKKIYVGHSVDIKRRMWEHNNINKNKHLEYICPCDRAIIKYGKVEQITILEECSLNELDEKEKYWITFYQSNQKQIGYNIEAGGKQGHGCIIKRNLTDDEILDIRKKRYDGMRKKDVYSFYKSKISFGGFEKIWLGTSFPQLGKELLSAFDNKTRQEYSSMANIGTNNGQSKLNAEEIRNIRATFENRDITAPDRPLLLELATSYNVSVTTIFNIVHYNTYKNIEPVSTIPYVEMQGSSATIDT